MLAPLSQDTIDINDKLTGGSAAKAELKRNKMLDLK